MSLYCSASTAFIDSANSPEHLLWVCAQWEKRCPVQPALDHRDRRRLEGRLLLRLSARHRRLSHLSLVNAEPLPSDLPTIHLPSVSWAPPPQGSRLLPSFMRKAG